MACSREKSRLLPGSALAFEPQRARTTGILRPGIRQKLISGDDRDRTGNPRLAKPVLSQLSYVPVSRKPPICFRLRIGWPQAHLARSSATKVCSSQQDTVRHRPDSSACSRTRHDVVAICSLHQRQTDPSIPAEYNDSNRFDADREAAPQTEINQDKGGDEQRRPAIAVGIEYKAQSRILPLAGNIRSTGPPELSFARHQPGQGGGRNQFR